MPLKERKKALELLYRFRHIFSNRDNEISFINIEPYKIHLHDETPFNVRPYKSSAPERDNARNILDSLEKSGVIYKTNSEYCSPAFIKTKPNGKSRLLNDYRTLNKKITNNCNTVPRIEAIFEAIKNAPVISSMDLSHGYYQFPIHEDCQKFLGFRLDSSPMYAFTRLPQGLKISAAVTTQATYEVFSDIFFKGFIAYIDDYCTYSNDIDSHLQILEEVLKRLETYNFKLNPDKCEFFENIITLLGHDIGNGQIKPSKKM